MSADELGHTPIEQWPEVDEDVFHPSAFTGPPGPDICAVCGQHFTVCQCERTEAWENAQDEAEKREDGQDE